MFVISKHLKGGSELGQCVSVSSIFPIFPKIEMGRKIRREGNTIGPDIFTNYRNRWRRGRISKFGQKGIRTGLDMFRTANACILSTSFACLATCVLHFCILHLKKVQIDKSS